MDHDLATQAKRLPVWAAEARNEEDCCFVARYWSELAPVEVIDLWSLTRWGLAGEWSCLSKVTDWWKFNQERVIHTPSCVSVWTRVQMVHRRFFSDGISPGGWYAARISSGLGGEIRYLNSPLTAMADLSERSEKRRKKIRSQALIQCRKREE